MYPPIRMAVLFLVVLLIGMLTSCGGPVRTDGPNPQSGAATIGELLAIYRDAHQSKDPEKLRKIDLTSSLLADWMPMDGEVKSTLLHLFELDLEDVRMVDMPLMIDPNDQVLSYASQNPNGEPSADTWIAPDLYGRLVLIGRRPDGKKVEVDPGLGVTRLNGRLYMHMLRFVTTDAANSVHSGTKPRCRLIPHATHGEYTQWTLDGKRTWPEAMRKLDQLEQKAKQLEQDWKAAKERAKDKDKQGGRK